MGQMTWNWLVIIYLFLGGLGAGAFLTAAFFELSDWRYRHKFCPTCLTGAMISGPAVFLGCVLLIFDLGAGRSQPWRIIYLYTNFSSVMTWGIWILTLFIPVGLVYGLLELVEVQPFLRGLAFARVPQLMRDIRRYRRLVAIVGSFLAVATAIYTGVLISDVGPSIPLWSQPLLPFLHIPLMPLLFLVSAISTGLALTFDLAATLAVPAVHDEIRRMPLIHIILVTLEMLLIGLLLISALSSGGAGAESVQMLITGPLSVLFWVGIVLIGLVFPFSVYLYALETKRHSLALSLASGAGVVLAGLFLRYLVVVAGIPAIL